MMKKSSMPLFIAGIILPYSMLAAVYFFIDYAVTSIMFLQVIFVIFNCLITKKLIPYIILSANLLICSIAAYRMMFLLDTSYVYCDPNSPLYIRIIVISGCISCVCLPLVGRLFFLLKKAFNYDRKLNSDTVASLNKNNRIALSIAALALILAAVVSIVFFAMLLTYSSNNNLNFWGSPEYLSSIENRGRLLFFVFLFISFITMSAGITMTFFERHMGKNAIIIAINSRIVGFAFLALLLVSRMIYALSTSVYFDLMQIQ